MITRKLIVLNKPRECTYDLKAQNLLWWKVARCSNKCCCYEFFIIGSFN